MTSPQVVKIPHRATAKALLQIGSGFHPEFSGRENAFAYLAQLGINSDEAENLVEEITEFSELQNYINQPLKTYSTGMVARLMFSTSTAVSPELLILDEILGVGDAYFTQKCISRIKKLCENEGTTLLLVTHDLYSAVNICERFIWLDQGAILLDANPNIVVDRYEASIRDQQEARLRKLKIETLEENLKDKQSSREDQQLLFCQIRCKGNVPIDKDLPIKKIVFLDGDKLLMEIDPGSDKQSDSIVLNVDPGDSNWGEPELNDSNFTRSFSPRGSIYHRASFIIKSDGILELASTGKLKVEISIKDTAVVPCIFELFHSNGTVRFKGSIGNSGTNEWVSKRINLTQTTQLEAGHEFNRYGNQDFSITDVDFLNGKDKQTCHFEVGERMKICFKYQIRDPGFKQRPTIQVSFLKNGVTRSHRFTLETEEFDYNVKNEGRLEIVVDPLLLSPGTYHVNVVAMSEGGYKLGVAQPFFAINPNILDHHSRAYEIEVLKTGNSLIDDTIFSHPATWVKDGEIVSQAAHPLDGIKNHI